MSDGARCMWMRGGTSKGGYFLAEDLPADTAARDAFLLRMMGSPDPRQIDGMGGADPLTSKVAVVNKSEREGVDVDYLFLQVFVDQAIVVRIRRTAATSSPVSAPSPSSAGWSRPGTARPGSDLHGEHRPGGHGNGVDPGRQGVTRATPASTACRARPRRCRSFRDTAGSTCGALLPTGNDSRRDRGRRGDDDRQRHALRGDVGRKIWASRATRRRKSWKATPRCARLEAIRLACGPMMNLGDVTKEKSVPKMTMVSPAKNGGASRRAPSFRIAATRQSACSARSASARPACCLRGSGSRPTIRSFDSVYAAQEHHAPRQSAVHR
jgi:4-oxalomesaconate tautomerase